MEIATSTAEETRAFGERLAVILRPGDLLILTGPLGAGKTALTQGIGAGLGVLGQVASPTFVISRIHRPAPGGRGIPLVHVDAYRLGDIAEVDDLDLDESLEDSVTVVEWGEGKVEHLSGARLEIRISGQDAGVQESPRYVQPSGDDDLPTSRRIELLGEGDEWSTRLSSLNL